MALAGLFSLILGWWASPIDHAATINATGGFETRFFPVIFGARGIVPIGYAAFAFTLGVLVGLMIRRTVPAMGITLAVIAVVQIAFPLLVRPHLIAPVRDAAPVTAAAINGISSDQNNNNVSLQVVTPSLPGAWIYSNTVVNRAGSTNLG